MKIIVFLICLFPNNIISQNGNFESLEGRWKYQYSYNVDTSLNLMKSNHFDGEYQMSKKYSFPKIVSLDTSFTSKYFISNKWENNYCYVSIFKNVEEVQQLNVIYYSDSTRTFKLHWFLIEKVEGTIMYIYDERMYSYSNGKNANFFHVYKKKKGLITPLQSIYNASKFQK